MKEVLRQRALELGFDACRFTTADPPDNAARLQEWLGARHHGEMGYLQRNAHKRVDPRLVLPGARSVVCLAASYSEDSAESGVHGSGSGATPDQPAPPRIPDAESRTTGLIARYARYADYHDVLGERLKILADFMVQLGGAQTRALWYVDTGPLLERDLAQRAGVGFIGKHTNLIHRQLGNWFLLSEIITTLELEPDHPEPNRCGRCVRCLEACPTGAIIAPFQLDARLCVSYLTIELKGSIPVALRPAIGNRIFGCDDCLAACPWNRFAQAGRLMRPHQRTELQRPDLLELLALDEPAFKARFAGTPIWRVKRRGLLRNVCVALGNTGDQSALPALQRTALDPEPLIAEHAAWALERIQQKVRPAEGMMGVS